MAPSLGVKDDIRGGPECSRRGTVVQMAGAGGVLFRVVEGLDRTAWCGCTGGVCGALAEVWGGPVGGRDFEGAADGQAGRIRAGRGSEQQGEAGPRKVYVHSPMKRTTSPRAIHLEIHRSTSSTTESAEERPLLC